jgi:hypothetical protein
VIRIQMGKLSDAIIMWLSIATHPD